MSQRNESHDITRGIFLLILVHIIVFVLEYSLGYILILIRSAFFGKVSVFSNIFNAASTALALAIFGIGFSQWLYVTPLLIWLRRRELWGLFKGVLIGALLTLLLGGSCFIMYYRLLYFYLFHF